MLVAAKQCDQRFECDCSDPGYDDFESCVQGWTQRVGDLDFVASMADLDYDGHCVARLLDRWQSLQCDATLEVDDPRGELVACPRPCKAFIGPAKQGEACSVYGATVKVDDCEQGLHCSQGRCIALCPAPVVLGERCMEGIEEVGPCAEGLLCDPAQGRCIEAPAAGSPCVEHECGSEAFCDRTGGGAGVCAPKLGAGEVCLTADRCISDRCEDGSCQTTDPLVCAVPQTL